MTAHPHKPGLFAKLRAYFLAGILVTAPIAITAAVAIWFIELVDSQIVPLIPGHLNPDTYLREVIGFSYGLPGLGVIVLLVFITLIGALTAGLVGRYFVNMGEAVLQRMPVIRSVYSATKQVFETVLKQQSDAFRQAVLVEYPRRGAWTIAFVTGNSKGEIKRLLDGDYVNVYVPTTPNPTSGFLLFVPREDMIILDMPVDEAFKALISLGLVTPEDKTGIKIAAETAMRTKDEIDGALEDLKKSGHGN
ncbi:DUF502 domain-containing protein [Aestuariispira insulae]|uniref:Putative membrane protein n=1 Tax=Aestuariispira insulae TaxID=1461337 RepID=A0A3D9HNL7_9PROT|nr:DUF502 domain-containing protein [Aestuariispira insulae]RED51069.1 putative membrane protein [Aestuariispira insulae]